MRSHALLAGVTLAALLAAAPLTAQRRTPGSPAQAPGAGVTIALKVAGSSYDYTGQASCQHAPQGSIYGTVASRWSVAHSADGRSLNMTLWRPTGSSGDMVNLTLSVGGRQHTINTVKGPGTKTEGSASVKFAAEGQGGTFTIDGRTGDGATVTGTITCDRFSSVEAVAGD